MAESPDAVGGAADADRVGDAPLADDAEHVTAAPADPAEAWVVATFNLVAFALPLVLLSYASGGLSDVLPGVGTLPGLAGFGYLWLLVWLATRWTFAEGGLARSAAGETGRLLVRGAGGGALVGMGFVAGLAVVLAVVNLVSGMVDVTAFVLLLLVGAGAGGLVGVVVGLLFGVVDVALYRASGALLPADG
jgi:hypothetical protein